MRTLQSRIRAAWQVSRRSFERPLAPVGTLFWFFLLRAMVRPTLVVDRWLFPRLRNPANARPIVLAGNPRTGTTFLHRFLADQGYGAGAQLWRLLYPSLLLQRLLRPLMPLLRWISPARHHSTVAHETGLDFVETDDVGLFFHHFDGLFLYGFLLAFHDDELRQSFDPQHRDTNTRDFDWWEQVWVRSCIAQGHERAIAKSFSLSARLPAFLNRFPEARVLYLARDPVDVIPSCLSLVTGVLDRRYAFWTMPPEVRDRFIERLYTAFVELLCRFEQDWRSGAIDRTRVFIVRYDRMMEDFDGLMHEVLAFCDLEAAPDQHRAILEQAEAQRSFVSKHSYDLGRFGLSEERIRQDCAAFCATFLS